MGKKLTPIAEKLAYVESVMDQLKTIDDVVCEAKRGVSTVYKWMKEKAVLEEHVKNGRGAHVRVTVKMHKSLSQRQPLPKVRRGPRPPSPEVQGVLRWLARSPAGSVSLDELVEQFSKVPNFPTKTKQAKWIFVRRLVKTYSLHQHVSFKVKVRRDTTNGATSTPRQQTSKGMPTWSLSPIAFDASQLGNLSADLDFDGDGDFDLFSELSSIDMDKAVSEPDSEQEDVETPATSTRPAKTLPAQASSIIVIDGSDEEGGTEATTTSKAAVATALSLYVHVISNLYDGDIRAAAEVARTAVPRYLAPLKRCPPNPECICWEINNRYKAIGCNTLACTNVAAYVVCPENCKMRELCGNQGFDEYGVEILHEVFDTQSKGLGIRTLQTVSPGQFAFEYVCEVLGREEFDNRYQRTKQDRALNYYFMKLSSRLYLDAQRFGNHSRFINHSCDPNCVAEVWTKRGAKRVAIMAVKEIEPLAELTFDYGWLGQSHVNFTCMCGSPKCKDLKITKD